MCLNVVILGVGLNSCGVVVVSCSLRLVWCLWLCSRFSVCLMQLLVLWDMRLLYL